MATAPLPLGIVIPARDEAAVLGPTLDRLRECAGPDDVIIVIDDGSEDDTAKIAKRHGAQVRHRRPIATCQLPSNKGAALRWWLAAAEAELDRYAGIVILDADTLIDRDFLPRIRARLAGGAQAMQGFVVPVWRGQSASGYLAGFSELLEQKIDDHIRAALNWPVRLRGTGMAFCPAAFRAVAPHLKTHVEDVEMSLLLAGRGVRVVFVPEARVFDPKPAGEAAARRQRARWLRGQWQVWRCHWLLVLRLLLRGPGAWSLVGSTLIKPRTLIVAAKMLLLAVTLLLGPTTPLHLGLTLLLSLTLAADLAYFVLGILFLGDPVPLALCLPGWVWLWWRSLILALRSPSTWLRARERGAG